MAAHRRTTDRPFGIRITGAIGLAVAAVAISPMGIASADDQALPGAPTIRSSERGAANPGVSTARSSIQGEYRAADIGVPFGGGNANNGGGLVKDGNASTVNGIDNVGLCSSPNTFAGYGPALGRQGKVECDGNFGPYN